MSGRRRTIIRGVPPCLLTGILLAAPWLSGCGDPPAKDTTGPVAAVLLSGPDRVLAVDLAGLRVAREARLRSLALDMDVDPVRGLAVTAQCGGVGDACDHALGVYDLRRGGSVRYVELGEVNPGFVAVAESTAVVSHGAYADGRLYASLVDLRSMAATGGMLLADGPGWVRRAAGRLWTSRTNVSDPEAEGSATLVSVMPPEIGRALCAVPADGVVTVVDGGDTAIVIGADRPGGEDPAEGAAWLRRIDRSGRILASSAIDMRYGVADACLADGVLWILDGGPDAGGARIIAVDALTMSPQRDFEPDFAPVAMAGWGDKLLVLDAAGGRLEVREGDGGQRIADVGLGVRGAFAGRVVVLDGAANQRTWNSR